MMKNLHSRNLVEIGSWGVGPEIRSHEYLTSPIEISVNWPASQQFGTRPIYTAFNGANSIHVVISRAPMNRFM